MSFDTYPLRLAMCILSVFIAGFGVFVSVKTDVIILAAEGFVLAVSENLHQEFGKVKIASDISFTALGVILALVFTHSVTGFREGTLLSALGVGLTVQLYNRLFPRFNHLWTEHSVSEEIITAPIEAIKPHLVVTITREFGPNSVKIAHKLAEETGLKLYDEELVEMAIAESGLDPVFVRRHEESMTRGPLYALYTNSFEYPYLCGQQTNEDALFHAQEKVIRRLAETEDCIILGRNANAILGKSDNHYHVFLHGEPRWRIQETMREFDLPEHEARRLVQRMDTERKRHCHQFTGAAWGRARDFNLALDVARYGVDTSVKIIEEAISSYMSSPELSKTKFIDP